MRKLFGREQLLVRTVFISSRMDELAMERQSAFNAIYEAGLTPILFEMEPRSAERKKIDALVDRADLYLGLYYQSMGKANPHLCDLTPIQYELYRFLARFDICPHPESWEIREDDREQISRKMDDTSYVTSLRNRLRSECRKEGGPLFKIVKSRVRLYLRIHEPDNTISRQLLEFLDGLIVQKFGNTTEEPPAVIQFLQEYRYIPAHLDLFNMVFARITRGLKEEQIRRVDPDIKSLLLCKVAGYDQPGLIFTILDVCFSRALNIKALSIHKAASQVEVSVLAEPFYQNLVNTSPDQVERFLTYRFSDMGQAYKISCCETESGRNFPVQAGQIPKTPYYYEVITFDVPGIIMLVARLVAHFGGNIEFIHFEDNNAKTWETSKYSTLTLAVSPLAVDARIEQDRGKTLEYELESLLGVAAVFRRSLDEIVNRFTLQPLEWTPEDSSGKAAKLVSAGEKRNPKGRAKRPLTP